MTRKIQRKLSSVRVEQYANDVIEGRIVAGPHVRNSCRRHLLDLEEAPKRGLKFCHKSASRAIDFFEAVLKLSEGQFEGKPLKLEPSQAFIVGSLFGWLRKDGTRRFRRAYIEQGKGNGKSPIAGGIGLYGMLADGEAGAQIYAAAAKRDQAMILFQDAVKMVRQSPALAKRVVFSGGMGREYNMAHHKSGSYFRPVSREAGKSGSGPRPHFVLADEVHELPDRKVIEMLERGFKFRRQPLLFMITNSGSDRNSVAWEEHEHAVNVAAGSREALNDPTFVGEVIDDTTFSYVCALDDGDDPLHDPSCWIKANPLLGVTITEQYLADVVAQAKAIPGQLNGILRLHFCQWTDADEGWMTRGVVEPLLADFDISEHAGKDIFIGLDLSQTRDITAIGCAVRTGQTKEGKPTFDAWVEAWTPGDTMLARETRDKMPYTTWEREGYIHAPPGEAINYRHVAQRLIEYSQKFKIAAIAYDRYAFRRFEDEVTELGVTNLPFIEHPQGGTKKGKPVIEGAEGLWFPGSLALLEEAMLEGRVRLKRNPVLVSALMSAVTEEDRWGNRWLAKKRSLNKIDAAVALVMGLGAASGAPPAPAKKFQMFILGGR